MNYTEHLHALRRKSGTLPDRRTRRKRSRGSKRKDAIKRSMREE